MDEGKCRNCGKAIERDNDRWIHMHTGIEACSPFKYNQWAEPMD